MQASASSSFKLPIGTFGPISIHPDFKRQGYGLKLLKYALEKAKAMELKQLTLPQLG